MSDAIIVTIISNCVILSVAILGVVANIQIRKVHKLVNSSYTSLSRELAGEKEKVRRLEDAIRNLQDQAPL